MERFRPSEPGDAAGAQHHPEDPALEDGACRGFRAAEKFQLFPPFGWLKCGRRQLFGEYALLGRYKRHPDPRQETLFWALLRESLTSGAVSEEFLKEEMARGHLRHDALERIAEVPTVAAVLGEVGQLQAA